MIQTERLLLRPWQDADRAPFAAMSADAEVMRYLMNPATPEMADAWIDRQIAHQAEQGFCFWAMQERPGGAFVGSVGLARISYTAHFTPAVEVGWRLARSFWGGGYAPEAARAALRFGFDRLGLQEIVANACVANERSQRVMQKIGMTRTPAEDFDHPMMAEDHPLRRHVLYRVRATAA